jgi:uncharacterized protein (TIGR02452 family)
MEVAMSDANDPKVEDGPLPTKPMTPEEARRAARREELKAVAQQTLEVLRLGEYVAPSGEAVNIAAAQRAAVEGTVLYGPEACRALLHASGVPGGARAEYEVTDETTQSAASRLAPEDVAVLNYASARRPAGGFLTGASAQEEELARCSGLYPCLQTQAVYYDENRRDASHLYTDHIIYSPRVPWFRLRGDGPLLDQPFVASVITAPAPNAGKALKRDPEAGQAIEERLRDRAGMILGVARDQGHRTVVLGAWGCGVFKNPPALVADAFAEWLENDEFAGAFDRVVFAVFDPSPERKSLDAFRERFSAEQLELPV